MLDARRASPHHGRPAAPGSITAHPLFATALSLWTGALTALSLLAVRADLLARLALRWHLDSLAMLGLGGRIALAIAAGAGGALLGWLVAKALGPRGKPRRDARKPALASWLARRRFDHREPRRSPFNIHESLAHAEIMRAERPAPTTPAPPPEPAPPEPAPPSPQPAAVWMNLAPPPGPSAADRIASGPLEALGSVELVERLAIALQQYPAREVLARHDSAALFEEALAALRALS